MPRPSPRAPSGALGLDPAVGPEALGPGAAALLRRHLSREGADLVRCCLWLGGERWAARADALATLAERAARGDAHAGVLLARQAGRLHALLTLEVLDDLESPEALRFAGLDLTDPRVARCCRHAEALGRSLEDARPAPVPPSADAPVLASPRLPDRPDAWAARAA